MSTRLDYTDVFLNRLKKSFGAGNAKALMQAIALCADQNRPLPSWVAAEFLRRYGGINSGQFRDWNAAFGPARPKGVHLKQRLRIEELAIMLFDFYPRFLHEPAGQNRFEAIADAITATCEFGRVTGNAVRNAWDALSQREKSALTRPSEANNRVTSSEKATQTTKAA